MTEASVIVHKVNIQEIEDDRYTLPPYSCFFLVYLNISRVLLPHGPRLLGGGERGYSGLLHALASAGKR